MIRQRHFEKQTKSISSLIILQQGMLDFSSLHSIQQIFVEVKEMNDNTRKRKKIIHK